MDHISNIIFDLGGIFLNIDFNLTQKAFTDLGIHQFNDYYTQHHASALFQLLETGKITPEEFHHTLVGQTGVDVEYNDVVNAWNALLLDFPPERLEWLNNVNKRYKTFLFSNTNKIHYDAFSQAFKNQYGKNFDSYFIKAYYSHEMGLRKPDLESFEYIIKEQHLVPSETLFIDDTLKNIEGAKKAGLKTIHLVPPVTVVNLKI